MNKYKVVTIIFIIVISIVSVKTLIDNRHEIVSAIKSNDFISQINEIFNSKVGFSEFFLSIWSTTQNTLGAELLDDAEYGSIIKDDTGNLYFPAPDVDVKQYADNTIAFSKLLEDEDVNFTYIQAPNKVIKGYSSDIVFDYNFSNKNADEFLSILKRNNVKTLDLRKLYTDSGIPVDELFYKSDHHWTTPTAFWAFQEIVKYLNEKEKLDIDSFYTQKSNYEERTLKDCFLGSLGRRVGDKVSEIDDYIFIKPKFETDYEIINGATNEEVSSGDFMEAIVIDKILNSDDIEENKHGTYFEWDYGHLIIKNNKVNNNLKILMIKDSYALPVGAFLSTCVKELHMVDLRDKPTVNLNEFVKQNKFDAVIMLYNTEVFNDTMFNFEKTN